MNDFALFFLRNLTMNRKIFPIATKRLIKEINEIEQNNQFWMTQTAQQRIAAVTFLSMQYLRPGQTMDRYAVAKFKMHK